MTKVGFQVEREKRKAAAQAAAEYKKASENQGWLSWAWGGAKAPKSDGSNADERADLTDEEYQKLEDIVSEREEAVKQSEGLLKLRKTQNSSPLRRHSK